LKFQIELDREEDGRGMVEIGSVPGVMAYGKTKPEALAQVEALARRGLADQPVNKGGSYAHQ
jgi:predicted RNase H-like HicB family nuclease